MRNPDIERPGLNGVSSISAAVKCLEAIAGGIPERNQAADAPRICERLRPRDNVNLGSFQPGRELIQCRGVGDLPAEEALAFRHRAVDDDALLAVVHPEGQQRSGLRSTACKPTSPVPNCRQSSSALDPNPAYPRACNDIARLRF